MAQPQPLAAALPAALGGLGISGVRTSNPLSTWAGGDLPIPYRVAVDPALTDFHKIVYGLLNRFRVISSGGDPFPSERYVATSLGKTERGVRAALKRLADRGWIKRKRRGRGNTNAYILAEQVPEAAWADIQETESAVVSLRLDRHSRAAHTTDDRHRHAARTTELFRTREDVPPFGGTLLDSLSCKEEIAAVLKIKHTRRQRRDQAIRKWHELVAAETARDGLADLLTVVGMTKAAAAGVSKHYGAERIKAVCANVAGDIQNIPGYIRAALTGRWKVPPTR